MISPEKYKIVSRNLSNMYVDQVGIESYFGDGQTLLTGMISVIDDVYEGKLYNEMKFVDLYPDSSLPRRLLSYFTEKLDNEISDNTLLILDATRALQKHVIDNYGDVNLFLSSNSTKVDEVFAELSEEVGVTIDAGNIE